MHCTTSNLKRIIEKAMHARSLLTEGFNLCYPGVGNKGSRNGTGNASPFSSNDESKSRFGILKLYKAQELSRAE